MEPTFQTVSVILLLIICSAVSTRNMRVTLMLISSFLCLFIPVIYDFIAISLLVSAGSLILFLITLLLSLRKGIFRELGNVELKWWRIIARPFAVLFIPIRIFSGERFLISLLGGLSLIFIGTDLYRIISRREFTTLFKKTEFRRFSSMTSFLVAIFILFLLFPPEICYLCLVFIIFGDMTAKLLGIRFGRTGLFHGKTLEGSLGFLAGCIFAGSMVWAILHLDFSYLIIGALFATVTELFSFRLDDNFTVGVLTGGCLYALNYFQII